MLSPKEKAVVEAALLVIMADNSVEEADTVRGKMRARNMLSEAEMGLREAINGHGHVEKEGDITSECFMKLTKSQHSDGYYCNVFHKGKSILALGVDEASKCILSPGYKIVKANGAVVSFRIFKKYVLK